MHLVPRCFKLHTASFTALFQTGKSILISKALYMLTDFKHQYSYLWFLSTSKELLKEKYFNIIGSQSLSSKILIIAHKLGIKRQIQNKRNSTLKEKNKLTFFCMIPTCVSTNFISSVNFCSRKIPTYRNLPQRLGRYT